MELLISIAALVLSLLALLVTLTSRQTTQHFYAYSSCRREVSADGKERESWSFTSGYANTFIGRTVGPLYIAIARLRHKRLEQRSNEDGR